MTEQEDVKFLRSKKFRVIETPTGFKFEVEPCGVGANDIPDLYIAKDECEAIQRIGVILEIRSDIYRDGRPPTLFTIVQTHRSWREEHNNITFK